MVIASAGSRPTLEHVTWKHVRASLAVTLIALLALPNPAAAAFLFSPAAPMSTPRFGHIAVVLAGGRVLIAGGIPSTVNGTLPLTSAELYDPTRNSWSMAASPTVTRSNFTATLLNNGKVLVAAGDYPSVIGANSTAELYDPAANTWGGAGAISGTRYGHTATLLLNGKVLIAGGEFGDSFTGGFRSDGRLYDPAANTWSAAGNMTTARAFHTAVLLPDGKTLVMGGHTFSGGIRSADFYDSNTNAWSAQGLMPTASAQPATRLPNGQVFVAGGVVGCCVRIPMLYDPPSNSWSTMLRLQQQGRAGYSASLIGNRLIISGGIDSSNQVLGSVEQFDVGAGLIHARAAPYADFNANGVGDWVWFDQSTGDTQLQLDGGPRTTVLNNPMWRVIAKGYFDSDGFSDLLWHNTTSGEWVLWLMRGTSFFDGRSLLTDSNWAVTHLGDFNADGNADLVWRNSVTGSTAVWLMNGLSFVSGKSLLTDLNWRVTQVGDFNGDGKSDLIWRNDSTGESVMWIMDGTDFVTGTTLLVNRDWSVTHVADVNGDGKSDLLWRNSETGDTALWQMDATNFITGRSLLSDPNWQITQIGDFNGDGKSDLIWRNSASGETVMWMMDGNTVIGGGRLLLDPNWSVVQVGDYNGDGKTDLLWHNSATSEYFVWNMDGMQIISYGTVTTNPNLILQ